MKSKLLPSAAFATICLTVICLRGEILALAADRNEVAANPEVWAYMIQQPFGIMQWLGCWLTQLCHSEILGATVLAAILTASFAIISSKYRLSGWHTAWAALPAICIIWHIHSLGYWMYCMRLGGCIYSHALALLAASCALTIPSRSGALRALLALALYPLLGFWTLALALSPVYTDGRFQLTATAVSAGSAAVAPIVWWLACYSPFIGFGDIYTAGLPQLINYDVTCNTRIIPLAISAACAAALSFVSQLTANKYVPAALATAAIAATLISGNHGHSFEPEIRMTQAAGNADWNKVKAIANSHKEHTESMKVLYELAMAQTSTIGSEAFAVHHKAAVNEECHSIKASAMYICACTAHYYYGRYNTATRWGIELGVKYGFGIGNLKTMARSAMGAGEQALCQKYLQIIRQSLYHRNWQIPAESIITKDFRTGLSDQMGNDHSLDEYLQYSISLPENTATHTGAVMAMYYAMRDRSKTRFMKIISADSLHPEPLPIHMQEACAIFGDTTAGRISAETAGNFQIFSQKLRQLEQTQNKSLIKPLYDMFGQTYWWYVYFEK